MFVEEVGLKNFKSFKNVKIKFEKGVNCIVGPNGSGKTNIVDAIMFALGESRIRSLRAKKTPDLIFNNAKFAEVELKLSDGKGANATVSRAIRRDGKIKYLLNGKRSHRYTVQDFLRQHNISTYNIIQQGQVQQIVQMNSKERRGLIDQVANVLEYEEKKKEAFAELDKVQSKLKEAGVMLSEREGMLQQLKQDKEDAEKYNALKTDAESLKATLLSLDLKNLDVEFTNVINNTLDLTRKSEALATAISELDEKIREKLNKKDEINQQITSSSQGKQVVLEREVNALREEIEKARIIIEEKKAEVQRNYERGNDLSAERMKAEDEVKGVLARIRETEEEQKNISKVFSEADETLNQMLKASDKFSSEFFGAKQMYDNVSQEMANAKEKLAQLQAEGGKLQEVKKLKEQELERLKRGNFESQDDKKRHVSSETEKITAELKAIERSSNALFEREKALNAELTLVESEMLKAKIKVAEISTRLQHSREAEVSRAHQFVMEMKETMKGIYGTVEELCSYDSKFALPVQVGMGNRSNYVILDSARTAEKLIDQLKSRKLGRVSFIPLDKIRPYELTKGEMQIENEKGAKGFLINLLKFDKKYENAFKFACSNTLICSTIKESEHLIGKARLVTMEGELIEQSALITGGTFVQKINLQKEKDALEVYDKKQKESKEEKERILEELYALRESISLERKKKADLEVGKRALELEMDQYESIEKQNDEKQKDLKSAVSALKKEIEEAGKKIDETEDEKNSIVRNLSDLNIKMLDAKSKIDVEKEKNFGVSLKEKEKKVSDLKIQLSERSHALEALKSQQNSYERELKAVLTSEKEAQSAGKTAETAMKEADALIRKNDKLAREKTAEMKELSSSVSNLIDSRESIEKEVNKFANQKGKNEFEKEKIAGELQKQQVQKAVVETNLTNVKVEFENYKNSKILDIKDKAQLVMLSKKADEEVAGLGNINLKAIEEYDIRAKDFEQQKIKVQQLANEKEAVAAMIKEIEGKKIMTFMETYDAINANFVKLFSQIFKGKGSLYLENKENPFEGGLTIEAHLDNTEVKYLEEMSGGQKSLIALIFLFSIQAYSPSSIYILDEVDAALDQENERKLGLLLKELSKGSQFLVVSHKPEVFKKADCLIGVAMAKDGSQLVEVKLNE